MHVHIKNPYDPLMDAALMVAKTVADVSFSVNNDLELLGFVNELQLSITELYPYFSTKTTIKDIN